MIACYRIAEARSHGGDVTEALRQALAEADHYGMSPLEIGMRRYIQQFAEANGAMPTRHLIGNSQLDVGRVR